MSQTIRPVSTISTDGHWAVTGATLQSDAIADTAADGDTTKITADSQVDGHALLTVGLGAPASTPASLALTVTLRAKVVNGGDVGTITVTLYQGATALGTGTVAPTLTTYADFTLSMTPAAVTDWSDLRLGIDCSVGDLLGEVAVTQVYVTVADGATASGARTGRAARMLRNTVSIQRGAETQAATGESVKQFTTLYSSVPASVQIDTGSEAMAYFRETGKRTGRAYFSPGTDVLNTDRLVSVAGGGISGFTGATLAVTSPPLDHAGMGAYLMATWEEVLGGPTT